MNMTAGQQLRQKREARSLTLEQVSKATHMGVHYLQAIEEDNYAAIPSAAQARGFVRTYAEFLGQSAAPLLHTMHKESLTQDAVPPTTPDQVLQEAPPQGFEETEQIFREIGDALHGRRELLGLPLDEVERHTHLRLHYLEALEAGDFDSLPSPVQGRGMLSNYAVFLGLDQEQLLLRSADALQARHTARQQVSRKDKPVQKNQEVAPPSTLRKIFSGELLVVVVLVFSLGGFAVWGGARIFAMNSEQTPTSTAPSIVDVLLASPTATMTFTPAPVTPTPQASVVVFSGDTAQEGVDEGDIPVGEEGSVDIYLSVHQRAWMRVVVDGEIEYDGRVLPGSAYSFVGESQVDVLSGSGSAIQVHFNQQDLGFMGIYGDVVHRVYTLEGILEPTATITLTPTETLEVTITQTATSTPVPGEATQPPLP
jgi:cytoskeleton protein RodZ